MIEQLRDMYLELLQAAVTNSLYKQFDDSPARPEELEIAEKSLAIMHETFGHMLHREAPDDIDALREDYAIKLVLRMTTAEFVRSMRANAPKGLTMVSNSGMENVCRCAQEVIERSVAGDFMECGVWQGGVTIFMRGLLKAFGDTQRVVWVADSFRGLPTPDAERSPIDAVTHEFLKSIGSFRVSLEDVRENFRRFHLLDEQVRFLPGWFEDTLPTAPVQALSLLRLDGDYYDSTRTVLDNMYPKLSEGGFIIIDDYGMPVGCRRAVDEYRATNGIDDPIVAANEQMVFWRKSRVISQLP